MAKAAAKKFDPVAAAAAKYADKEQVVNPDKLKALRAKIAKARDLELTIAGLLQRADEYAQELTGIRTKDLPSMFEELGLLKLTLEKEGNMPECEAKVSTFYSARLPDDTDPRRAQAFKKFKWLHELVKHEFKSAFAKGEDKKAKALATQLKKLKIPFEDKVSVNGQTLTAEIRRRFEAGTPLPPADLELLGATVGTVVKIDLKKAKEK